MNAILDTILNHISRYRTTPNKWLAFKCPICMDKKVRCGIRVDEINGGFSIHCFNCNFKTGYMPGNLIGNKLKKFMVELNIDHETIQKLQFDALKLLGQEKIIEYELIKNTRPNFKHIELPGDARPLVDYLNNPPNAILPIYEYVLKRNLNIDSYNFHWSPADNYVDKLIIPCYYNSDVVGYMLRNIKRNSNVRYIKHTQADYIFNMDNQHCSKKEFVLVTEGPFDAISVDGVALLGSNISKSQNYQLKQLYKEIILVPDRDKQGANLIEQAMEYGWTISFAEWPAGAKDVNESIMKIGKLATMWLIVNSKEQNKLKQEIKLIQLKRKLND